MNLLTLSEPEVGSKTNVFYISCVLFRSMTDHSKTLHQQTVLIKRILRMNSSFFRYRYYGYISTFKCIPVLLQNYYIAM